MRAREGGVWGGGGGGGMEGGALRLMQVQSKEVTSKNVPRLEQFTHPGSSAESSKHAVQGPCAGAD